MPIVPAPADDPPCLLDGADMGLSRTNGAVGPRGNIELPSLCVTPADNLTRFADRAGAPPPPDAQPSTLEAAIGGFRRDNPMRVHSQQKRAKHRSLFAP